MKLQSIPRRSGGCSVAAVIALSLSSHAQTVTVDGMRDQVTDEGYVLLHTQTTPTNWIGPSQSLANIHAKQEGGNLFFHLAAKADGNAVIVFIDSKPGGVNFINNDQITNGGEDEFIDRLGSSSTTGLTFESGFEADYAIRIFGAGTDAFVNVYNLVTGERTYAGNSGPDAATSAPLVEMRTIWGEVAPTEYATASLGVEMKLAIAALGVPQGTQPVKIMALLVNGGSTYGSNQVLGSRVGPGDMGDGQNGTPGLQNINFETEEGTQTLSFEVTNNDTDSDGLPDAYEQAIIDHAAQQDPPVILTFADIKGPNDAPATSDYDNDGVSDAQEYIDQTGPTVPDTDDDGLTDGQEATLGTNPLVEDTDSDGLSDGAEVNTHGTNPLEAHSDTDGENDGTEVFQDTDPNDPASSSALLGLALIDGVRDDSLYSTPLTVQTIETGFGDNQSEWNAGYAYVNGGKLYLMLTGNLQSNFNKLEIFIDSKLGGSNTFNFPTFENDNASAMNGMVFDDGFAPDYHLIARRGLSKFDLNFANLGTTAFSEHLNVFGGSDSGRGITGTGPGNTQPIRVGYDGSNTAGIGGDPGAAANQEAAAAVTTGLELCIDLADLGNPVGPIKVMVLQNNDSHNFLSNQTLAGLPVTFGNLGNPATVDFGTFEGDQFFTVGLSPVHLFPGNTAIRFTAKGLTPGDDYIVESGTMLNDFEDVTGSEFTAAGTVQVVTLSVNTGDFPAAFFRVKKLP